MNSCVISVLVFDVCCLFVTGILGLSNKAAVMVRDSPKMTSLSFYGRFIPNLRGCQKKFAGNWEGFGAGEIPLILSLDAVVVEIQCHHPIPSCHSSQPSLWLRPLLPKIRIACPFCGPGGLLDLPVWPLGGFTILRGNLFKEHHHELRLYRGLLLL